MSDSSPPLSLNQINQHLRNLFHRKQARIYREVIVLRAGPFVSRHGLEITLPHLVRFFHHRARLFLCLYAVEIHDTAYAKTRGRVAEDGELARMIRQHVYASPAYDYTIVAARYAL